MEPSNLATAHILQVRVKNREFLVRHYLKTLDAVYGNRFLGGNAKKFKVGPHLFSPLGKWKYGLLEPSYEATTHGTCPSANRVRSMPRLWYSTSDQRGPMDLPQRRPPVYYRLLVGGGRSELTGGRRCGSFVLGVRQTQHINVSPIISISGVIS